MNSARHPVLDGWVEVVLLDEETGLVAISASMPACLLMAASPWIKEGAMGGHQIDSPLRAWVPSPGPGDMKEGMEGSREAIGSVSQKFVSDLLLAFSQAGSFLKDPGVVIPMLPMGVYVKCTIRCGLFDLARTVEKMPEEVFGMGELRRALAGALAHSLERLGMVRGA